MKSKIVWWTLTLLCAAAILLLGIQPASVSSKISQPFADLVVEQDTTIEELPPAQQAEVKMEKHESVRDQAHVCMYAALSVCTCMLAWSYFEKRWYLISVPACAVFGAMDEFLQDTFAEGRVFQMTDILHDWLGIVLGAVMVAILVWWIAWRRMKREATNYGVSGSGAG